MLYMNEYICDMPHTAPLADPTIATRSIEQMGKKKEKYTPRTLFAFAPLLGGTYVHGIRLLRFGPGHHYIIPRDRGIIHGRQEIGGSLFICCCCCRCCLWSLSIILGEIKTSGFTFSIKILFRSAFLKNAVLKCFSNWVFEDCGACLYRKEALKSMEDEIIFRNFNN